MDKVADIADEIILHRFSKAVTEMLADDDLVKAAPQEFSITPDLAMKLQPHFPEWRVSADWTSRKDKMKQIIWQDEDGKLQSKPIRPDIIIHRPHTELNILVIEAKRAVNKNNTNYAKDVKKLSLMTLHKSVHPDYHYGYRLGVHLIMDLPHRTIVGNDVYRNGEIDPKLTELLWKMVH
ncbi:hypothetical protein [Mesorhizobium sp. ES1-4]|uniref:hypothetical protein n=1 Tax=Mesorhizobium sp. ES1-4 TaxID=2876627 RepID=UPI001CCBA21D|nr:hypothetical protein [Mesorhizobium sp. ES1-4]MBZ9798021.1 hypothetical protein [Mesorhizobium sp. ES1-4]